MTPADPTHLGIALATPSGREFLAEVARLLDEEFSSPPPPFDVRDEESWDEHLAEMETA